MKTLLIVLSLSLLPAAAAAQGVTKNPPPNATGPAASGRSGYVSTTTQTFSGAKTFEASTTFSADGFNFGAAGTPANGCGTAYGQGRIIMVNGSGSTKTKLCMCTLTPTGTVWAWQDMATGTVGTATTC